MAEEEIQIILCLMSFFIGLLACVGLYYLANYDTVMLVTVKINKMFRCFPKILQPRIFVHAHLINRAVAQGENHFYRYAMSKDGEQTIKEFEILVSEDRYGKAQQFLAKTRLLEKSNQNTDSPVFPLDAEELEEIRSYLLTALKKSEYDARYIQAQMILKQATSFEKNTDIRSKLLSLAPEDIVMDEIRKPNHDGSFPAVTSSHQFDLPLVMFLAKAGQVTPVNLDGNGITFEPSDNKTSVMYVRVLETLLSSSNINDIDDSSSILQRLVEDYTPEADLSSVKRILYYCTNGPSDTVKRPNRRGETLLHHAKDRDLCKFLIRYGAQVDVSDRAFRTPLHLAIER